MHNAKLKFAISTIVSVIAAFFIFLVVLMIAQTNHHTFDLTQDKRFTISPQSVQVVKELPQKVQALVFLQMLDSTGRNSAEELLNQYQQSSDGKLTYRIVDPKREPLVAKKYEVRMPGCVVFVAENERTSRAASVEETVMTNALLNLSDVTEKKVYFLTGHGEIGAYSTNSEQNVSGLPNMSQFRADLTSEGFIGLNLNLAETKKIPDDAAVVVIPGPTAELLPAEAKLLEDWLAKGGRMLLTLRMETLDKYDAFLGKYGFKCADELVIDEMAQLVGAEPVYSIAMQYNQDCPVVKDFNMTTLFRLARTVEPADKQPSGAKVLPMAMTGPNAYTIKLSSLLQNKESTVSNKDILRKGTMPLAAAGTYAVASDSQAQGKAEGQDDKKAADEAKPEKNKEGRIIVIGNSDFCCNDLYKSAGNRDFALNTLNWLAASDNRITIRAKEANSQPLILAENTAMRIKIFLVIALPLTVLILGIVNARRRRA
ncbi:GldG family protein [bacterium]|nr:GldG family protein [bacterium]